MARPSKSDILQATIVNQVGTGIPVAPEQIKELKRLATREIAKSYLIWGAIGVAAYAALTVWLGWVSDKLPDEVREEPPTE